MKKGLLFIMLLSMFALTSMAQQPPISHCAINNINATILNDGTLFVPQESNELGDYPCTTWEVPVGSGKQTIFQHSLWFGGLDATDSLHLAAYRFGQIGQEYWSGPLKTTDATIDLMTTLKFHRIWNLSREEIDYFIAHHGETGYEAPNDILSWPAHGEGEYAQNLAPFVDVDGNGHYNPEAGDYPDIKGDQCLFFIFNDSYNEYTESGGEKIGLEVHAMVYAYDAPDDEALNNTVFVNYKFFNRSANDYHDVYLGLWNDWDLGYSLDDYVGCDVQRNSCFAYNGMPNDGDWGGLGSYGDNPPVQVLTVLAGPYSDANERLGMTGFLYHDNYTSNNGDPNSAEEYYNYLNGLWKDGQPMLYGGNAYNSGTLDLPCKYMFPGDSDPDNIGTNGIQPTGYGNGVYWTEEQCGNTPYDRRGLAMVGPFSFLAGSMQELDYAHITAWKDENHSAMERKGEFIDHIRELFNNGLDK